MCVNVNLFASFYQFSLPALLLLSDPNNTCDDGLIRLADGATLNEGRLEICYYGHWGTVCDDGFNSEAATVACRQLGFEGEGYHYFILCVCVCVCVLLYKQYCSSAQPSKCIELVNCHQLDTHSLKDRIVLAGTCFLPSCM